MFKNQAIFAELFGLVVFDLDLLLKFKQDNQLNEDLLTAFTTSELGNQVSNDGIAIPIIGIAGEYYHIAFCNNKTERPYLKKEQIVIKSDGWIIESIRGELTVCGIGYFKIFDVEYFANTDKFIRIPVDPGWYEVEITGGVDDYERLVYEFIIQNKSHKPDFMADFEDNVNIIE